MIQRIVTVLFVCSVFFMVPFHQAQAKGLYVRDWITISVRTSPYETAKMIGLANTNDFLEVIDETEEWTKVRTPEGKEGWVQNRYLTKQTPKALLIDQLNEKVKSLSEDNQTLREENKQLQKEHRERNYKISSLTKEVDKVKKEYTDLESSSSEYLELKKNYDALQAEYTAHAQKMEALAKENSRLKTSDRLIFTFIGGGFIIVGLVIGVLFFMGIMGAGFYVIWNKISSLALQQKADSPEATEEVAKELVGPVYGLDTFIVNLADKGGSRYLRLTIEMELKDSSVSEELEKRLPQIKDCILMTVPTKKVEDIQSIEGKNRLRDELLMGLNGLLKNGGITKIYFTEFVIQ